MSDLIDRQTVLDELEKWDWQDLYLPIHFKQILDDVPSVENKGEWIGLDSDAVRYDDIMCSNCKKHFTVDAYRWCDIGFTADDLKFCPNCGARMKGGE